MNIYLTCYGLDTRYKKVSKGYKEIITLLKDKKVIIIPNAKLVSEDKENFSPFYKGKTGKEIPSVITFEVITGELVI